MVLFSQKINPENNLFSFPNDEVEGKKWREMVDHAIKRSFTDEAKEVRNLARHNPQEYLEKVKEASFYKLVDRVILRSEGARNQYYYLKGLFDKFNLLEDVEYPYFLGEKINIQILLKVVSIVAVDGPLDFLQAYSEELFKCVKSLWASLSFENIYLKLKEDLFYFKWFFHQRTLREKTNKIKEILKDRIWFPIKRMKAHFGYLNKNSSSWINTDINFEINFFLHEMFLNTSLYDKGLPQSTCSIYNHPDKAISKLMSDENLSDRHILIENKGLQTVLAGAYSIVARNVWDIDKLPKNQREVYYRFACSMDMFLSFQPKQRFRVHLGNIMFGMDEDDPSNYTEQQALNLLQFQCDVGRKLIKPYTSVREIVSIAMKILNNTI